MQKRKPAAKKTIDPEQAQDFIAGADYAPDQKSKPVKQKEKRQKTSFPWESEGVRSDVTKTFNLRIPEPLFLKLKFLAEHTPKTSMHKVCIDSIEDSVKHDLKALIIKLEQDK